MLAMYDEELLEMKRYLLRPGLVKSKHDSDSHYVGVEQLVRLYEVSWDECAVAPRVGAIRYPSTLISLFPLYHGNYEERAAQLKKWKKPEEMVYEFAVVYLKRTKHEHNMSH